MKILLIHNAYQEYGGEDAVAALEERMLVENGYSVVRFSRHNDELKTCGTIHKMIAGVGAVWAARTCKRLQEVIEREQPNIAHFHNTFPLISPAAYYVCNKARIPVVQTLHNYRLLCPGATLFRDGQVCESCISHNSLWPSVAHACYRGNRVESAATAAMLMIHRGLNTWRDRVDVYVALSDFSRRKFIAGGLPAERIVVKPNFVHPDPGSRSGLGGYALFVGRLCEEKGIRGLLSAWRALQTVVPLLIAGEGPLHEELQNLVANSGLTHVSFLGGVKKERIMELMRGARFLVLPSVCFEHFPLTIVESMACGLPVLLSKLGSMAEIIDDGRTGLHFRPNDPIDCAAKVQWAWANPVAMTAMGDAGRVEYEEKYTVKIAMKRLSDVYAFALERFSVNCGELPHQEACV